jgi:hypothetical protein
MDRFQTILNPSWGSASIQLLPLFEFALELKLQIVVVLLF